MEFVPRNEPSKCLGELRDLKMEPSELRWNTSCGLQNVFISNPTNKRRAIKVKCSDNNLYRVNPVYSFIEPGQVLPIDILRQNGGAKVDKMVFTAAAAKKEDQNPRALFQNNLPKPMMVLPLIATFNKA
uniref:Major sperm protein n=1 Tax=Elaeophora elaphi TaxID=1147741 RepID=A0A0R3RQP9_9BILA